MNYRGDCLGLQVGNQESRGPRSERNGRNAKAVWAVQERERDLLNARPLNKGAKEPQDSGS